MTPLPSESLSTPGHMRAPVIRTLLSCSWPERRCVRPMGMIVNVSPSAFVHLVYAEYHDLSLVVLVLSLRT